MSTLIIVSGVQSEQGHIKGSRRTCMLQVCRECVAAAEGRCASRPGPKNIGRHGIVEVDERSACTA